MTNKLKQYKSSKKYFLKATLDNMVILLSTKFQISSQPFSGQILFVCC